MHKLPIYNRIQPVGGRPQQYAPALSSLCGRRSALRRWAHRPAESADRNVAVVSHGSYVPTITAAAAWRVNAAWVKRPGELDLWPFDLESGVRVTCDLGYLCANFSLPRPLCSRVTPDVRDRRQTDRRQTKASLNIWCMTRHFQALIWIRQTDNHTRKHIHKTNTVKQCYFSNPAGFRTKCL